LVHVGSYAVRLSALESDQGPNLQNFARQTYENVTKKSDIRKVFEKTYEKLRKTYDSLLAGIRKAYERIAMFRRLILRSFVN